ncbi:polyadenylate-binding protein 2-like [Echinops telfairi]|uniref:Polyadenylate-binding protein 2-like n=1 Tax=Echinops telfairi TaxID=9371 RepID=A0AC55CR09_ECHTE|nr:polyadenylate-binding protein 2-like [Echinops telfairi]
MAATSPDMEAAGRAGSQGARWGQRPLVPGASGDADFPSAIKDHRKRQEEPEEMEPEELLLDYEAEPVPEQVEHSLPFCSEAPKHPGTLKHSEREPVDQATEDQQLEAIQAHVREMTEEIDKIKEMQKELAQLMKMHSPAGNQGQVVLSPEEKKQADARSIYVGNVDYGASAEELEAHFLGCGSINRVTILSDKFSGHPKGFAYIEFSDKESAKISLSLDESLFRGRQIKVIPKRTNRPGLSTTNRGFPRAHYGGRSTNHRSDSQSHGRFHRRPGGPVYRGRPVRRGGSRAPSWYPLY